MRGIYAATKQSYERPRMYAELRAGGVLINHKCVGRFMKLDELVGILGENRFLRLLQRALFPFDDVDAMLKRLHLPTITLKGASMRRKTAQRQVEPEKRG
jgi:hypothetical protein